MPRLAVIAALVGVVIAAAGCSSRSGPPAPVSRGGDSRPALSRSEAASGVVVVQPGDTLYAVARRTGTPVRALIDSNHLQAPYRIQAGQRLQLPKAAGAQSAAASSSTSAGPAVAAAPRTGIDSAPIPPPASGSPTSPVPAPVAAIPPPPPAPGGGAVSSTAQEAPASPSAVPAAGTPTAPAAPVADQGAAPSRASTATPVSPPAAVDAVPQPRAGRFTWPVRGSILSSFGAKPGGLQNDGINIAAPRGTPVRAAENGVVVYAGNELKGFGNLLLLRHADGWMSAYAHLDEILVERGANVQRGQNVAKVGQSGSVASPQLHFEIRRAGRAVDPRTMLAPLQTADAN